VAYAKVTVRGPNDTRLVIQVVPLGTGGRADNVGFQFSHEREFILKTNQQPGVSMMFKKMVSLVLVVTWCTAVAAEVPIPTYKKLQLTDKFTCEGAYYGDFNRDGHSDVVTAWHCHLYGLVWHRQVRGADGQIGFEKQVILPSEPNLDSGDLRISHLHAFDLVDMDGDGLQDIADWLWKDARPVFWPTRQDLESKS
jgi:hypothetical protein